MKYPKFTWWMGFIEESYDDPLKLGRVRARAVGYHPSNIPTDKLPLALILNGGSSKINKGDMVLGFFLDGVYAQQPVILGGVGSSVSSIDGRFFGSIAKVTATAAQSITDALRGGNQPEPSPDSVDKEFWTLVALASKEAWKNDSQGQADVAQSVYNRVGAGKRNGYAGPDTISGKILQPNQYEPTFNNLSEWKAIRDVKTAATATKLSESYLIQVAQNIQNTAFQKEAAKYIQGRTDFFGTNQPAVAMTNNGSKVQRNSTSNQFGFTYAYNQNIVYPVPDFIKNYKI